MHRMNYGVMYDPGLSGEIRVPVENMTKMELDERKIIARRAAFELPLNGAINLGVGAPDGVASVAAEEKVTPYLTMTTEAGAVGGVLAGGSSSAHRQTPMPFSTRTRCSTSITAAASISLASAWPSATSRATSIPRGSAAA